VATATSSKSTLETQAINAIRTVAIDAVQAANSGHPGLPLGAAPMAYVLWQNFLKHNPRNPEWADRDRFVLSAGHGSALIYSLLHLTGYDLSIEEVKAFRKLGSKTPGHPERGLTPGVEVTTGPLGQGFANGVGLAIAEAYLAAKYNKPGHEIVNHYTYAIVSDGDLQEGVAFEAAAIAGNLKLGKLIYLYDQNHITLAGTTHLTMNEDVPARFEAMGWHVQTVDGLDPEAVNTAIIAAQQVTDRPSIIAARTIIGFGSPNKANTFGVHGSPLGPDELKATKEALGVPTEPAFFVPDEVTAHFHEAITNGASAEEEWTTRFAAYKAAYPAEAAEFEAALAGELPEGWDADIPTWEAGSKAVATRRASGDVLNGFFAKLPTFIGGSADLNPSTNTALKNGGDFQAPGSIPEDAQGGVGGPQDYSGRNIHFGIREHGMGAIVNGIAAHGGLIAFTATFLPFSDYMRPSIRLAALSHLPSIFVFTHDSIAVGEDGPTHEAIEQTASLRLIPHLTVFRPADANETAEAWKLAVERKKATVLVFSRQDLPILDPTVVTGNVAKGGYIVADTEGTPDVVLLATGSEVSVALAAKDVLAEQGVQARVASFPSLELFDAQSAEYRASVLGPVGTARVSVEAGVTATWFKYTGENGAQVGIDTYGASGPGNQVLAYFGFTKEHVAATALRLLGKSEAADELDADFLANGVAAHGEIGTPHA